MTETARKILKIRAERLKRGRDIGSVNLTQLEFEDLTSEKCYQIYSHSKYGIIERIPEWEELVGAKLFGVKLDFYSRKQNASEEINHLKWAILRELEPFLKPVVSRLAKILNKLKNKRP